MLLVPDADKAGAYRLAERLREELAKIKLDNLPAVTLSLGIASFPIDGTQVEDLNRMADAAMYAAKRAGRNQSIRYSKDLQHNPSLGGLNRAERA